MQLLRPAGALAEELQGVVAPWPRPGRYKELRCEGSWEKWRIKDVKEGIVDSWDGYYSISISIPTYIYIIYVHVYVFICIYMYIYIYMYMYMYMF